MIVEKVLNNNVVVSIEPKTRKEIILMGQGIAFGKKIGQEIDESKIEKRFMVEDKTLGDKIKKLINQIPEGVFELADEIISYASKELDTELDKQIYISLSDHIAFAIKRFKNNISLKNDLLNEIRRIHKKEFKVALWVVDYLNEKLEINLPEDEVKEFATALVRARGTIKYCSICGNFTETDPCPICSNPSRDKSVICVVEQPKDIMTMEKLKNLMEHIMYCT